MRVYRGIGGLLALMLAAAIALAPAAAQDATPIGSPTVDDSRLAGLGYSDVIVTTDGQSIDAPDELEAGRYRVVLENTGSGGANLEVLRVPEGMTIEDIEAVYAEFAETGMPPAVFYESDMFNGGTSAGPGSSGEVVLDLAPGQAVFNLYFIDEATGEERNMPQPVTITGEMPADLTDPEGAILVDMFDFDFEMPDPLPAGANIWQVVNTGEQPHHIVVSQIPDGTTEEQVAATIAMLFGMPQASPEAGASPAAEPVNPEEVIDVFETPILSPGVTNWISPDLGPGTYVALCFIPTPDGIPHVMLGMIEVFTVGDAMATPAA